MGMFDGLGLGLLGQGFSQSSALESARRQQEALRDEYYAQQARAARKPSDSDVIEGEYAVVKPKRLEADHG